MTFPKLFPPPQLPQDKANHFLYGVLMFCAIGWYDPLISLFVTVAAGAAKELYDSTGRGRVEFKDFLATAAGGVAGFVCTLF